MNARYEKWIFTVAFMDLFAVSLVMPLMSTHLKSLGASHFLIGLFGSVYSGVQLFSGPVVGSWSDIRGRRVALLFTQLVCCLCYFSIGFVNALWVVFLLRVVIGLLKHTQSLCKALVADVVTPERQPAAGSRLASFSGMGFMVGPALGGVLFEREGGFTVVCSIVAALFLLSAGISCFLLPSGPAQQRRQEDGGAGGFMPAKHELVRAATELASVDWTRYWDVFAHKFLSSVAMMSFFMHCGLILTERYGTSQSWVGYTISFQGSVSVAAGFLLAWLDRFYARDERCNLRTLHGFAVLALSFALLGCAPNLGAFLAALVPLSAASSLLRLAGNEVVIRRTPPDKRGSLVGAGNSVASIARLISPLVAGVVYDTVGESGVFACSIASAVGGALLSCWLIRRENKQRKHR
ncbi:major facilitator superfamily domain-containing protein 9-like [Bacillus rossius redtenbacheri]|uniref:major facilitator superfamily domain-containing protein 9-like n=1 Tax=Bacillus rossius redtenbacheri TaxID=93214 RepID=UPI002FDC87EF